MATTIFHHPAEVSLSPGADVADLLLAIDAATYQTRRTPPPNGPQLIDALMGAAGEGGHEKRFRVTVTLDIEQLD